MAADKNFKIVSNVIEKCEDVPEIFIDGFKYACMSEGKMPYTVHVAKYNNEGTETVSQLISLNDEGIFCFDKAGSRARLTQYNYDDIAYIKKADCGKTSILEISGESNGRFYESRIEYNKGDKKIFDCIINSARLKEEQTANLGETAGSSENLSEDSYELLKLAYFKDSHPRLYSYAVDSLLPGQKIRKTVFQNKVFKKTFKVVKTRISRTYVMILAGNELIIISEGRCRGRQFDSNTGGYWYYIPVSKIAAMDIRSESLDYLTLKIALKNGRTIGIFLDNFHKAQIEQLVDSTLNVYNELK